MTPVLAGEDSVRRYASREVVAAASLAVEAGESVALLGPSGCGKTTLLHLLGLLDRPDGGRVTLDGVDAWSLADADRCELRLRALGFVFQQHNLLEHLSARDNVALPAWRLGGSQQKARAEAMALLERVGLRDRALARARELSVGEAQRVAIARAIINRPRVVLCDEPTGALDSATADEVLSVLTDSCGDAALVLVTHDRQVAARARRQLTMRDGRVA